MQPMAGAQQRGIVGPHPREDIGRTLQGDILEIGPGHAPFPTAPGARLTYADRSVEGGRDATWPELAGQPRGPRADLNLDLDITGLSGVVDEAFDAVIACHLIEHLANPVAALREFGRVLRPGGRLVLIVPDRTRTFDAVRAPTPLAHLLDDYECGVTTVDEDHIREFCEAIFGQPPIHPDEVRAWYDPMRLDDELLDLHRRRSIHVHCWTPEEFAAAMTGFLARGLMSWDLVDVYFFDDEGTEPDNEFGLVLERPRTPSSPADQCSGFVRQWAARVLEMPTRDPRRLGTFHAALLSNVDGSEELVSMALNVTGALGEDLVRARATGKRYSAQLVAAEARATQLAERLDIEQQRLADIVKSRSYRASRALSALLRPLRRH
jgi:SAM-dependent methyltransferase